MVKKLHFNLKNFKFNYSFMYIKMRFIDSFILFVMGVIASI